MSDRCCPGCGESIEGSHWRRKFCSEKCRKAQYAQPCIDCAKPTPHSTGAALRARTESCRQSTLDTSTASCARC